MKLKVKYLNSEVDYWIGEVIHSERNRKILRRKLIDGLTFEELASEFHLSVEQVKTIVYDGASDIFEQINKSK